MIRTLKQCLRDYVIPGFNFTLVLLNAIGSGSTVTMFSFLLGLLNTLDRYLHGVCAVVMTNYGFKVGMPTPRA